MITLHGESDLLLGEKEVLKFLTDSRRFSQCLPNLEELVQNDIGRFFAKFRVEIPEDIGVSYMKNIGIRMGFHIKSERSMVDIYGEGRSVGVKMKVDLRVQVQDSEAGSHMEWDAALDASLLERLLGKERFEGIARDIAGKIIACLTEKMKA